MFDRTRTGIVLRYWPIGLWLLVGILVGRVIPIIPDFSIAPGSIIVFSVLAGMLLLWCFRDSVEFNLLFVAAPFVLLHWKEILQTQEIIAGVPVNLSDVIVVMYCLVQGVATFSKDRRSSHFAPPEWFGLVAFGIIGIGLGFIYGNPARDIIRNARVVFYFVMPFLVTYSLVNNEDKVRKALNLCVPLGLMTVLTIWRVAWQGIVSSNVSIHQSGVLMANVVNVVGVTVDYGIWLYLQSLCFLLSRQRQRTHATLKTLLHGAMIVLLLTAMVISGLRTMWIVISLVSLYVVLVLRRLRPGLIVLISMAILAGVLVTVQLIGAITGADGLEILSKRLDLSESFFGRLEDTNQVIVAVNERQGWFLGNGLGASTRILDVLPLVSPDVEAWTGVHNSYAWYYLNLGLAGLVCLLLLIGRVFCVTFLGWRLLRGKPGQHRVLAANASVLAITIYALPSATLSVAPGAIVAAGIMFAVALRLGEFKRNRS